MDGEVPRVQELNSSRVPTLRSASRPKCRHSMVSLLYCLIVSLYLSSRS